MRGRCQVGGDHAQRSSSFDFLLLGIQRFLPTAGDNKSRPPSAETGKPFDACRGQSRSQRSRWVIGCGDSKTAQSRRAKPSNSRRPPATIFNGVAKARMSGFLFNFKFALPVNFKSVRFAAFQQSGFDNLQHVRLAAFPLQSGDRAGLGLQREGEGLRFRRHLFRVSRATRFASELFSECVPRRFCGIRRELESRCCRAARDNNPCDSRLQCCRLETLRRDRLPTRHPFPGSCRNRTRSCRCDCRRSPLRPGTDNRRWIALPCPPARCSFRRRRPALPRW